MVERLARELGVDPERVLARAAQMLFLRLTGLEDASFAEHPIDGPARCVSVRIGADLSFADVVVADDLLPGVAVADAPAIAFAADAPAQSPIHLRLAAGNDGPAFELSYDPGVLSADLAEALPDLFRALLESGCARPQVGSLDLAYLLGGQRERVLAASHGPERDPPVDPVCDRILGASATEDEVVVEEGLERMTRLELDRRSTAIALGLQRSGIGARARVGVFLRRSPDWVAAMVGVMRADMVYVPLSPQAPPERLRFMAEDAGLSLVIGDPGLDGAEAIGRTGCAVATAAALAELGGAKAGGLVPPKLSDDAYVLYTSGSTGTPKGVRVSHLALANYIEAARQAFGAGIEEPVFLQFADAGFDVSLLEVFYPLRHGGRLVVHHLPETILLRDFERMLAAHRVNLLSPSTAFFDVWSDEVGAGRAGVPACVRAIVVGGEVAQARRFARAHGGARLFNAYGPTEATVDSAVYPCDGLDPARRHVPIGRPLANTSVYVLDAAFRPVPFGVPGEIVVGGAGVAEGYVGRPDADAERFLVAANPDPGRSARLYRTGDAGYRRADGTLVCLGREDGQVKISGVRVDLSEVERALAEQVGVAQAAASRRPREGDAEIVAFVRLEEPALPDAATRERLVAGLARRLPGKAVPRVLQFCASFPLTVNGKIDRRALVDALDREGAAAGPGSAPSDPFERFVWQTWHSLMSGQPLASTSEDLFGKDVSSLRLGLFFAELADTLDIEIDLEAFEECRSVSAIAGRLRTLAGTESLPEAAR